MPEQLTGRELDAWLAENAMRWMQSKRFPQRWCTLTVEGKELIMALKQWSPSTDPRDVFGLVEAMRTRGFDIYVGPYDIKPWIAWGPEHDPSAPTYSAQADTPCLAIALAAHAALGGG